MFVTCGKYLTCSASLCCRRLGENPVDVTQQMNPFNLKVVDSNERPLQQVARNNAFYILAESTGKIPSKYAYMLLLWGRGVDR